MPILRDKTVITLYITADIDYPPISLINREFVGKANGDILYEYDLVNETGRQITAFRYKFEYLDPNRNLVKDREGYTGMRVTGENLAPYEISEGYYVDLTDNLAGIDCVYILAGITNVLFADGTIWRQPVLE